MIDWWLVGTSAAWIAGLAVLLAALSYHDWLARERGVPLRTALQSRPWGVAWTLGAMLVCAGLVAGRGASWWERLVWGPLAVMFAWRLAAHLRRR